MSQEKEVQTGIHFSVCTISVSMPVDCPWLANISSENTVKKDFYFAVSEQISIFEARNNKGPLLV